MLPTRILCATRTRTPSKSNHLALAVEFHLGHVQVARPGVLSTAGRVVAAPDGSALGAPTFQG
jgi:hypothetical protein